MIFLTIGTQFPFDRLVRAVDQALSRGAVHQKIIGQIGNTSYRPKCFPAVASMPREEYDAHLAASDAVISHAGVGTIIAALEHNKPLLVMPRLAKYGEVVNDHQLDTAVRFARQGRILLARDESEVETEMMKLRDFLPANGQANARHLIDCIRDMLQHVDAKRRRSDDIRSSLGHDNCV